MYNHSTRVQHRYQAASKLKIWFHNFTIVEKYRIVQMVATCQWVSRNKSVRSEMSKHFRPEMFDFFMPETQLMNKISPNKFNIITSTIKIQIQS